MCIEFRFKNCNYVYTNLMKIVLLLFKLLNALTNVSICKRIANEPFTLNK